MKRGDLDAIAAWLAAYVSRFASDDPVVRENIGLKERHTDDVRINAVEIARAEGFGENEALLGEAAAILHDVGRFPQFHTYRTYRDARSVNHAALGARVAAEEGVLDALPVEERVAVLTAVRYHSAFSLPALPEGTALTLMLLRLVRDADKLDIARVILGYLDEPPDVRAVVLLGLPDTGEYTREALAAIREGRIYASARLVSQTDYLLMQLSWVHDFNYRAALRLFRDRGLMAAIVARLPQSPDIAETVAALRAKVNERLEADE
jgi:hypothetical protein